LSSLFYTFFILYFNAIKKAPCSEAFERLRVK
jgi:hypothetical protein